MLEDDLVRRALENSFTQHLDRTLTRDPQGEWTAPKILGAAAALGERFSAMSGPVGVACLDPGWVLAALLAAWSTRRPPILLDPGLKRELDALHRRYPGISVFSEKRTPAEDRVPLPELSGHLRAGAARFPLVLPGEADLFASFFTSGSEGQSQVIEKRGRQFYRQARAVGQILTLPPEGRVLSLVPPYHLLGFFYGLFLPLTSDAEGMVATELTGSAMVHLLAKYQPALVVGTSTHYRALVRALGSAGPAPSPATVLLCSGAPLDPATAEALASRYGIRVRDFYGTTELGGVAWRPWPEPYQAMPGVAFRIDPESSRLEVCSAWAEAGEATWNATDDAAEPAGEDGFRLLGRLSHLVKVGAKRFSSVEVEQALRTLPGVAEAAVVPYDRFGEQAMMAFVVTEPGSALTEAGVRAFLAGELADFKMPRSLRFIAELPRGSHEKVDYAKLSAWARSGA
jgi:acyl-coenzyme A synthetase/AMP-(fatty) acid ligase